MPTIDQLQPAIVASDDDTLPISQGGTARRISRAQLLAGTQSTLALAPGLLGRTSPGFGPPEQIAIGAGLSIANGVLSGTSQYSTAALALSSTAALTDLVPVWQNGQDHAVTLRSLLSVSGIDVSNQLGRAKFGATRRLSDWLSDAISAEAFGAVGDGVTDDGAAISLAIASGRPVLLGPNTYRVDGQWNVQSNAVLLGVPGLTTLRRGIQRGGAWINVSGPSIIAIGISFDAGSLDGESWGVLLTPTCLRSTFNSCSFSNATGAMLGSGLTIQARDGLSGHSSSHSVTSCVFHSNACHGLWIQAASGAEIRACQAYENGGFGICLDFNDPDFQQTVRESSVSECRCWNNTRGISIGNYNATNREPPRWGLENPDAHDIAVMRNFCFGNSSYGIAVSGVRIQVTQNHVIGGGTATKASGILCNAGLSELANNVIVGPAQFGIDAGGSSDLTLVGNVLENCAVGINAGGSRRVRIADNKLISNQRAITLFQVETDGQGANFGLACTDIWIEDNLITIDAGGGGIYLLDGPERVDISRNRFMSASPTTLANLCWAHTDSATVRQNTWNGMAEVTVGAQASGSIQRLIAPEILDTIVIDASTTQVDALVGLHEADMLGQVSFIRVVNGGSGYSQAKVVVAGGGSGAAAGVYLRDGVVIGVAMSSGGGGYDPATTTAIIMGDGVGAEVKPFVGVPLAANRRLTLECLGPVRFAQNSAQSNWTKADITVPAGGEIVWKAVAGAWRATSFSIVDYIQPTGDGGVMIQSGAGDIRLRPGQNGSVRFASDVEHVGFLTCFGRGSPENVVVAPPGSDYRDLSSGAGPTLWIKKTGSGSSGWTAVA